jgi:Fe-S-cluster-containing dehydrogenase component/formate-dependent nitrite reductase membrane component NrfD
MRYSFLIDHNRCIGCHACTVACKEEHDVPLGVYRTWVKYIEKGRYPDTRRHFGVLRCNHCDNAPCVEICPTIALFRRTDGIVDFDGERCIGCKSCMQACPYDALYIDPRSNTAAKCNFCAHRVEVGLEPACVIVCPEQAIVAGDLDDASSDISRIVAREKVAVRKPEKHTSPKLFYSGIEPELLRPAMMRPHSAHLWADKPLGEDIYASRGRRTEGLAREVYDVPHPAPWGKKIVAYLWTKSVAAGVLFVAALLLGLGYDSPRLFFVFSPAVALAFTAATLLLLVFDLKRPDRFYYLFIKGNVRSWLVIGGYILGAYSFSACLWLAFGFIGKSPPSWLISVAAFLALGAAGYTAFLFAQAKGRDLWQSPMFFWHLLIQALVSGSAALVLANSMASAAELPLPKILMVGLVLNLAATLAEAWLGHGNEDAALARRILTTGRLAAKFWGLCISAGVVLPLLLIVFWPDTAFPSVASALLALAGIWIFDDIWMTAGQAIPLS